MVPPPWRSPDPVTLPSCYANSRLCGSWKTMSNAGTLDSVAIEISKLLRPLERDLAPERAKAFFQQIGITLTDAQVAAIAGPLSLAANRTGALLPLIGQ